MKGINIHDTLETIVHENREYIQHRLHILNSGASCPLYGHVVHDEQSIVKEEELSLLRQGEYTIDASCTALTVYGDSVQKRKSCSMSSHLDYKNCPIYLKIVNNK